MYIHGTGDVRREQREMSFCQSGIKLRKASTQDTELQLSDKSLFPHSGSSGHCLIGNHTLSHCQVCVSELSIHTRDFPMFQEIEGGHRLYKKNGFKNPLLGGGGQNHFQGALKPP